MTERLEVAIDSARRFLLGLLGDRDRATLITFSSQSRVAVPPTSDLDALASAVADLSAGGSTRLYDSVLDALNVLGGLKGKKAVVLFSDGEDHDSRMGFRRALEYARGAGVAIYAIAIDAGLTHQIFRHRLRNLSLETGGRAFFIDRAGELDDIYRTIGRELRSQYLLAYQSSNDTDDRAFRTVELRLSRPGLRAVAMRGYYP